MANKIDGTPHLPHTPNKIKSAFEVDSEAPPKNRNQQIKGWSAWGGKIYGFLDEKENIDEWFCQACAKKQPKEMDIHRLQLTPSISIRICSVCKHMMIKNKMNYQQLIERVRG